jgi:hypothetical protein
LPKIRRGPLPYGSLRGPLKKLSSAKFFASLLIGAPLKKLSRAKFFASLLIGALIKNLAELSFLKRLLFDKARGE